MDDAPYLSFVVTSRNDDHGGNLLCRMQAFVNGLANQCQRHQLSAELIVVEWNPPDDRPSLREVLNFPGGTSLQTRFIEVPGEIHRRFKNADKLPLHQMIGKNVGIRRARGRFILATNIDILFSDELMAWLAERRLEPGRMYRIDRHDVKADVPVDAGPSEQLEWCRRNLLRVNTAAGTFPLTPDGRPTLFTPDIVHPDAGLLLGRGWSPIERQGGERFRWLGDEGEIDWDGSGGACLSLDVEPGPSVRGQPFDLELRDTRGEVLGHSRVNGRQIASFPLGAGGRLTLRVLGGGYPAAEDFRILNCRVFRCAASEQPLPDLDRVKRKPSLARRFWECLPNELRSVLKKLAFWRASDLGLIQSQRHAWFHQGADAFRSPDAEPKAVGPLPLHLGTSGDFTLMAKGHWLAVRGYPEWPVYPLHVDSLLCYQAHHAGARETVLTEPLRTYHIEHARGTGGTNEDIERLCDRLRQAGVPFPTAGEVLRLATQMRRLGQPLLCNSTNWGLGNDDLPETVGTTSAAIPLATSESAG